MDLETLERNWAIAVAIVLFAIVGVIAIVSVWRRSRSGQLRRTVRDLGKARRELARAGRAVEAAEKRLGKLEARAQSVRPRTLTEAREAVEDGRALRKIAEDRVLVAANHVRRVIFEEYPPERQAALRSRYLPDDRPDGKPFSF